MESLINLIKNNTLFRHLSDEIQFELASSAKHQALSAQEIFVHQGDIWPYFFIIADGEINLSKESQEGRIFLITTLKLGDVFWGLAFFHEGAPMPVILQASTDGVIYTWRRDQLVPIIKDNGNFSWSLSKTLVRRMQLASDILDDLAFQPVMARLAGLLLDLFEDAEEQFTAREFTLEDMAARIGTTREMVCRHLYRFAEKGVIDISRTELKIKDRAFLETQAGS